MPRPRAGGPGEMRALVTGGAGFMGSHVVDKLMEEGYEVRVVDNLTSGSLENLRGHLKSPRFELVVGDLKDGELCEKAVEGVDAVFHFAANPEVRVSVNEPRVHFEENVVATFNVLEACRRAGTEYFVFASSSTVYGDPERIPTPEDHPLRPISVYGAAKLAGEELTRTYSRLYGIKVLILRYANVVGPRLAHGVVYDFAEKLRRDPRRLEVLGDGTQRKSYLHVSDAVEATVHLFRRMLRGDGSGGTFNVGNEDWTSVLEIADIVAEEMGLDGVEMELRPATSDGRGWPGDVKTLLLDISKLRATGWRPRIGSREAVREAARWLARRRIR